jgi:hypothetical protein
MFTSSFPRLSLPRLEMSGLDLGVGLLFGVDDGPGPGYGVGLALALGLCLGFVLFLVLSSALVLIGSGVCLVHEARGTNRKKKQEGGPTRKCWRQLVGTF